jgi:Protein of unknown function (DUF4232)
MNLTSRTARRVSAVAGAIGAAILIPAVALAAPGHPAAHTTSTTSTASTADATTAGLPKCTTSNLRVWAGVPGDGSAGAVHFQLELSNISSRSCTLLGYPGVSATTARGGQLGRAASRDNSHPVTQVVLGPGGTAHAELGVTDVGVFSRDACHPVTAGGLKVFPPNDFTAARFPFSFRACARRGPVYLHVSSVIPGTGIPGFSS